MPINRLLAGTVTPPEEIARLNDAYERALHDLCLVDRDDPLTEIIAKKIIEVCSTGISDPAEISERAIKRLGLP